MKKLRPYFLLLLTFVLVTHIYAQEPNKNVTITASGSGKTPDEARQSALRSAIEQAFGAFISSKTEIFNDQLVADQMTSVSSGNIQSYNLLNEAQLPDSSWAVTLKAIVSVDKLTSFVQARGITIEIKGGLFALNIKQQSLNELGEVKAINEMVGLLVQPMQISFDYVIKSRDPKSLDTENKKWAIPLEVTALANKNMDFCANYFIKTINSISLNDEEVLSYKNLNKSVFPVKITYKGEVKIFYLRKETSLNIINAFTNHWEFYTRMFKVESGVDELFCEVGKRSDFSNQKVDKYTMKYINFLTAGQTAAVFSWEDERSLAQIEQMTGYKVQPLGVRVYYDHGGIVVYEKDGHGFVVALTDLGAGKMNLDDAKEACENSLINGYSDWRLPTREEFFGINSLISLGIGNFQQSSYSYGNKYWTTSILESYAKGPLQKYVAFNVSVLSFGKKMSDEERISVWGSDEKCYVRAIRTF